MAVPLDGMAFFNMNFDRKVQLSLPGKMISFET